MMINDWETNQIRALSDNELIDSYMRRCAYFTKYTMLGHKLPRTASILRLIRKLIKHRGLEVPES